MCRTDHLISFKGTVPKVIRLLRDTDFSPTFPPLTGQSPSGLHFLAGRIIKKPGLYMDYLFSSFFSPPLQNSLLSKYTVLFYVQASASRLKGPMLVHLQGQKTRHGPRTNASPVCCEGL